MSKSKKVKYDMTPYNNYLDYLNNYDTSNVDNTLSNLTNWASNSSAQNLSNMGDYTFNVDASDEARQRAEDAVYNSYVVCKKSARVYFPRLLSSFSCQTTNPDPPPAGARFGCFFLRAKSEKGKPADAKASAGFLVTRPGIEPGLPP